MKPPSANLPARVIDAEVRAFLSSTKRSGPWTPGTTTFVKSTLASVELDLREAVLPEGDELCLDVEILLGNLKVTVPPSWAVVSEVELVLGNYQEDEEVHQSSPTQVLRIIGRVRFGSVEIQRREAGEGWLGAKRRRRRLRKAKQAALPPGD